MPSPSLHDLAIKYGTDKATHGYTTAYEAHFGPRRETVQRLLEIGIGAYQDPLAGGASLRMWRDYFPDAHVVGLDVHEKRFDPGPRITIVRGSQTDADLLRRLTDEHGPFDIVIDDGSHVNAHRNATFDLLFPVMADDGIYVLEDLHTSYLRRTYGGSRLDLNDPQTTVGMLKQRVDGLNHQYIPQREPGPLDARIQALCFYPRIAFVQKGHNVTRVAWNDARELTREGN